MSDEPQPGTRTRLPASMRTSVKWAAVLFGIGLLILISPVFSKESYSGKITRAGEDENELCSLTVFQAFVHLGQDSSDQTVDCTRKARGRVGYGLLLLLLSLPPAFISLLPPAGPAEAGVSP